MISIQKAVVPQKLVRLGRPWRTWLMQQISHTPNRKWSELPDRIKNLARTKYRNQEIKSALRAEAHSKCSYCETYIAGAQYADIDHFRPISKHPLLAFEWRNLLYSCELCNEEKSDYGKPDESIINPSIDNPESEMTFHFTGLRHGWVNPLTLKGERTRDVLKLDRPDLLIDRRRRLQEVRDNIEIYRAALNDPNLQDATRGMVGRLVRSMTGADASFSSMCNQYVDTQQDARVWKAL